MKKVHGSKQLAVSVGYETLLWSEAVTGSTQALHSVTRSYAAVKFQLISYAFVAVVGKFRKYIPIIRSMNRLFPLFLLKMNLNSSHS